MQVRRGDIFIDTDFRGMVGSEQGGRRPCIVISNDLCNKFSPAISVIPITKQSKTKIPTHLLLSKHKYFLDEDSLALVEQTRVLDKTRLGYKHTRGLHKDDLEAIEDMLKIQFGLK